MNEQQGEIGIPAEAVHAYAAAGFVVCGEQTGGSISFAGGYRGPKLLTTADDSRVTCPKCRDALSRPSETNAGTR